MHTPNTYEGFKKLWQTQGQSLLMNYSTQKTSYIPNLLPELAMQLNPLGLMRILEKRYGQKVYQAFQPDFTIDSPLNGEKNSHWMKSTNMVGVNVRTIHSFWNVVKYALTLPAHIDSIHLLPIWECGVVSSLYGMASWNINPEFFSPELAQSFPHLDSVEKQLKVVVNLLHLMGKKVGMDVIPHTDRYSEVVLSNPQFFEWLQRKDFEILDHSANLYEKVQDKILQFLILEGVATHFIDYPSDKKQFFSKDFPEEWRLQLLFGDKNDLNYRNYRRNKLIQLLYNNGYESAPATMGPPYRGLAVDTNENAMTIDFDGRVWRDFVITKPQKFSRAFGPLTRYQFYNTKDNNKNWEIDFDAPKVDVWEYVWEKFAEIESTYNLDFMRGDMSHVQMRPDGVPDEVDEFYDVHKAVKNYIQQQKPYFGYFAESFIAPDNEMAYGSEIDHLEKSDADSALGDLQNEVVGSKVFMEMFAKYDNLLRTRAFAPNWTMFTADKDDPRFDEYYVQGNEIRLFVGLFLTDMPSYLSLGFECRDVHLTPAPNEHYTKLYVFQEKTGAKATNGNYIWGKNAELFANLQRIHTFAESIFPNIQSKPIQWLLPPDSSGENTLIAWTIESDEKYLFVANLNMKNAQKMPLFDEKNHNFLFSTHENMDEKVLESGEGRVYLV